MDSALEKVGLYDFFGVFISGMLVVVVCYYLNLPLVNLIENTDNDICLLYTSDAADEL